MTIAFDASPVNLSYVAALRGVKPRAPETPFAYAQYGVRDALALICLAASNPEGQFYGVIRDAAEAAKAQELSTARQVENIRFGAPLMLPKLDYMVCDSSLGEGEREEFFTLAASHLKPSGLLACSYRAYANAEDILSFIVSEFEPNLKAKDIPGFVADLRALGTTWFAKHPASDDAKVFLAEGRAKGQARSGTVDVMTALLPRGFAYAGDAVVGANYMELMAPAASHSVLEGCREHLLYEVLRDFATQRLDRADIWVRTPAEQTDNVVDLFGNFTFGITMPREQVPVRVKAEGKVLDFKQKPYPQWIELLTMLPASIGDFLAHPKGKGVEPIDAVAALQMLVAAGIARPMRGRYEASGEKTAQQPHWVLPFNRALNETPITSARVLLASSIIGGGLTVSAREALVLQALGRGGMTRSVDALLPELHRVATDPALAAQIMDVAEPTPELAHNMVHNTVAQSLVRWYAYGVLAA